MIKILLRRLTLRAIECRLKTVERLQSVHKLPVSMDVELEPLTCFLESRCRLSFNSFDTALKTHQFHLWTRLLHESDQQKPAKHATYEEKHGW